MLQLLLVTLGFFQALSLGLTDLASFVGFRQAVHKQKKVGGARTVGKEAVLTGCYHVVAKQVVDQFLWQLARDAGDGSKYQSKCVQVSSSSTACKLVNTLVEKFYPDLKMLTAGRYALYEYHESSGERRMAANESPLMEQLNWAYDDREVRFILRDESKPSPSSKLRQLLDNQPSSFQNGSVKQKSGTPNESRDKQGGFARRWSSGSRKKKKKRSDEAPRGDNGVAQTELVPESSFTRTLSNPDNVLRRRREQRMQNRMQQVLADERGNTIRIYGDTLNPEMPYCTMNLTVEDTADRVVQWTLEKYGLLKQVNPADFCILQVNLPPRGERLPADIEHELTLHEQDSLLGMRIQLQQQQQQHNQNQSDVFSCVFHIRHRRAIGRDGRTPPPPPPPAHPRAPPSAFMRSSQSRSKSAGPYGSSTSSLSSIRYPCLIQVRSDADHTPTLDGLTISLANLFDHTYPAPIKLGTIEKMVGPPPNILVDKNLHPDIRPVHCTFSAMMASTSGSKLQIPKSGQQHELDAVTSQSLLITPSLDGFSKPAGPAVARVNGTRISGSMLVPANGVVQLGKSLHLKFVFTDIGDASQDAQPESLGNEFRQTHGTRPRSGINGQVHQDPSNGKSKRGPLSADDVQRPQQRSISRAQLNTEENRPLEQLPLTMVVAVDGTSGGNLIDRYVRLIDEILKSVYTEQQTLLAARPKEENRPAVFSLSPAYALYLVYRACQNDMTSLPGMSSSEKDHHISYVTNFIATRVFESLPRANHESADLFVLMHTLVYWLANCSELMQFFKTDVNLCTNPAAGVIEPMDGNRSTRSSFHACRQALHVLADAIDHCFFELRLCVNSLMQPLLSSLIHPGDADLHEDLRLDDKPIQPQAYHTSATTNQATLQTLLQLLTLLMQHVRRTRLNASLTIQLFAQLFHLINAHVINKAQINTEDKPRNARVEVNLWLTRQGATRLLRRLDRIKQWAQRNALERAAECRLQRCTQVVYLQCESLCGFTEFLNGGAENFVLLNFRNVIMQTIFQLRCYRQKLDVQACQLVLTDRSNLDKLYEFCMSLLTLNSIQLEWILSHLADPPAIPDDWIDLIATGGKAVNDRVILDELEHCMNTSQLDVSSMPPELQLTEAKELPLPLLLPPDGYASDAVLAGTPSGLTEFLRSLATRGLIQLVRNQTGMRDPAARPWACYLQLTRDDEALNQTDRRSLLSNSNRPTNSGEPLHPQRAERSERAERPNSRSSVILPHATATKPPKPPTVSNEESDSDVSESDAEEGAPKVGQTRNRYQPAKDHRPMPSGPKSRSSVPRQHASLPDLSGPDFNMLARSANVPTQSITRFYLRKYKNSLGMSIVTAKAEGQTHYGIYVKEIIPAGAADRDGRLDAGDQILAIGGVSLIGCEHADALATLTKQCQADEGVQLTVAQDAARFHRILELIQTNPAQTTSKLTDGTATGLPSPRPRHVGQFQATSQPDIAGNGGTQRIGSIVQPPSTRMGLKPSHQPRHLNAKSANQRRAGRDDEFATRGGSMSRSTPSLNLAEVGVAPDRTDQFEVSPGLDQRSPVESRTRDGRHLDVARTKSLEYALDEANGTRHQRHPQSGSESSGSDVIHNPTHHPPLPQQKRPGMNPRRPNGNRRPPSHSGIQASQSQPNINKTNHATALPPSHARRGSLSVDPAQPQDRVGAVDEQSDVSDGFSSLESVSSAQTPCSLHDSGEVDQISYGETSSKRNSSELRMRHPPPPIAPSQRDSRLSISTEKQIPVSINDDNHSSSISELKTGVYRRDRSPSKEPVLSRPGNTTQGRISRSNVKSNDSNSLDWRETDVDVISHSRASNTPETGRRNSMGETRRSAHYGSNGAVGSLDSSNRNSLTPGTSGSITPTSIDTVITKPPIKGNERFSNGTKSGERLNDLFITTTPTDNLPSPTIADVSHPERLTLPLTITPLMDDTVSETLKPPTHAVVSERRWKEDLVPSYAPELLPDLPILHNDPHRGRVFVNTEDATSNARHRVRNGSSSESTSYPVVHAEFVPGGNIQNTPSSLPPLPNAARPPSMGIQYQPYVRDAQPSISVRPVQPIAPYAYPGDLIPHASSSLTSPPPTPTADFPQYHPPDRLEPAEWTSYPPPPVKQKEQWPDRFGSGTSAPETAPKPHFSAPTISHPPASPNPNVRTAPEVHKRPIDKSGHYHPVTRVSGMTLPSQTSASTRVTQLQAELTALEIRQQQEQKHASSVDLDLAIDRLRAELRFQQRLADRETSRTSSAPLNPSDYEQKPKLQSPSGTTDSSQFIWEQKRTQAERELEASQRRRLAQLERDHQEMRKRQEQRAKERTSWFEQHKERTDTRKNGHTDEPSSRSQGNVSYTPHVLRESNTEREHPVGHGDSNTRYGRPRFDQKPRDPSPGAPRTPAPTQSILGPQTADLNHDRSSQYGIMGASGGDIGRVKKSVSFDKNLETISVYSPPTTSQDSVIENPVNSGSNKPGYTGVAYHSGNDANSMQNRVPKSQSSGTLSRTPGDVSGRGSTVSPNPVPNAELLSFKDKMRLFAQQIGEEPPKERIKLSSRQKQLLTNPYGNGVDPFT